MFTIGDKRDGLLRVRAEGLLSAADYRAFVPEFEARISGIRGSVLMLLELAPGFGWSPGGLWSDVEFNLRNRRTFSRIAVVGHRQWHQWITSLSRLLFTAEVRYFAAGEGAGAELWLWSGAET
jgi:hypothetical protein